jgi:hypothetical protein
MCVEMEIKGSKSRVDGSNISNTRSEVRADERADTVPPDPSAHSPGMKA